MHPTAIEPLDRRLGGGVPVGSLTALVAPVGASAELLLEAAAEPAPSLVVALGRPADEVADRYPDDATVTESDPASLAAAPEGVLSALPEAGTLIVTPTLGIEELDPVDQRRVLDAVKRAVNDAGGAGFLLCPEPSTATGGRTRTLHRADGVWLLDVRTTTLTIENRLYVTKSRDGSALDAPLKLKLTDRVTVDTSRDIA